MSKHRQSLIVFLTLGCCLALTACGGTSRPRGTATGAADANAGHPSRDLEFSQCMRAHGVTNFPDPTANGLQIPAGVAVKSPAFRTAQQACKQYLPNGGVPPATSAKDRAAALAFSGCMRSHGVPGFPDPAFTPPSNAPRVLAVRGMVFAISQSINPKSPAFRQAATACGVAPPSR
jgi:hypothetical protein